MRKTRQSVLAIEEDLKTREFINQGLSTHGYAVHSAMGASDGLKSFLSIRPEFVILSVSPLSQGGMATLRDICEADPHAQVITISSCTDDTYAMECIRHGAADYLKKPIVLKDLTRSIERINNRKRMLKIISEPDVECVQAEDKTLVFGNDIPNLPYILNQAVFNARKVCKDTDLLKTALGEILINAIEHGNLGITREEKALAIAGDRYEDLLKDRTCDPRYALRKVTLKVRMTRNELKYTVTDQGEGFECRAIFESEPHIRMGSGLGLFIARNFFTAVTFQGKGNQVVLVYRKPAAAKVAVSDAHNAGQ